MFQTEAPEDGAYVLEIDYTPAKGRTASPEADITVEGAGRWASIWSFPAPGGISVLEPGLPPTTAAMR